MLRILAQQRDDVNTLCKESGRMVRMTPEELRERRARLKLSQEELARRLDVTRQSVYMWERGETRPPGMLNLALRWLEHEMGVEPKEVRDA